MHALAIVCLTTAVVYDATYISKFQQLNEVDVKRAVART